MIIFRLYFNFIFLKCKILTVFKIELTTLMKKNWELLSNSICKMLEGKLFHTFFRFWFKYPKLHTNCRIFRSTLSDSKKWCDYNYNCILKTRFNWNQCNRNYNNIFFVVLKSEIKLNLILIKTQRKYNCKIWQRILSRKLFLNQ